MSRRLTVRCAHCSAPFEIYHSFLSRGGQLHCSRACLSASRMHTEESFWRLVAKGSPDECWEWQGSRDIKNGYGKIVWRGKNTRAHRVAMALVDGDWNSPLNVCHTCDNPPCCNPAHLWRGSVKDNMADKVAKNRSGRTGARGEKAGSAKLTAAQVSEIRGSPLTGSQLAKQYGVARNYIFAIKKRLTWRHLP